MRKYHFLVAGVGIFLLAYPARPPVEAQASPWGSALEIEIAVKDRTRKIPVPESVAQTAWEHIASKISSEQPGMAPERVWTEYLEQNEQKEYLDDAMEMVIQPRMAEIYDEPRHMIELYNELGQRYEAAIKKFDLAVLITESGMVKLNSKPAEQFMERVGDFFEYYDAEHKMSGIIGEPHPRHVTDLQDYDREAWLEVQRWAEGLRLRENKIRVAQEEGLKKAEKYLASFRAIDEAKLIKDVKKKIDPRWDFVGAAELLEGSLDSIVYKKDVDITKAKSYGITYTEPTFILRFQDIGTKKFSETEAVPVQACSIVEYMEGKGCKLIGTGLMVKVGAYDTSDPEVREAILENRGVPSEKRPKKLILPLKKEPTSPDPHSSVKTFVEKIGEGWVSQEKVNKVARQVGTKPIALLPAKPHSEESLRQKRTLDKTVSSKKALEKLGDEAQIRAKILEMEAIKNRTPEQQKHLDLLYMTHRNKVIELYNSRVKYIGKR